MEGSLPFSSLITAVLEGGYLFMYLYTHRCVLVCLSYVAITKLIKSVGEKSRSNILTQRKMRDYYT